MNKEFETLLQENEAIKQSMTDEEYQEYLRQSKNEFDCKYGNQAFTDLSIKQIRAVAIMSLHLIINKIKGGVNI